MYTENIISPSFIFSTEKIKSSNLAQSTNMFCFIHVYSVLYLSGYTDNYNTLFIVFIIVLPAYCAQKVNWL